MVFVKKRPGSHPVEKSFVACGVTTMTLDHNRDDLRRLRDRLLEDNQSAVLNGSLGSVMALILDISEDNERGQRSRLSVRRR
jgi:hypothetical protein